MDADAVSRAANWNYTATALSGHPCDVRFEEPARAGVKGLMWRYQNKGIVQIAPWVDDDELMYVYLHEVAHVKHDWHDLPVFKQWRPAYSAPWPGQRTGASLARYVATESQADRQAKEWLKACEGSSTLLEKHMTLALWTLFN